MLLTIRFKCPTDYHRMVKVAGVWQTTGALSEVTGDGHCVLTVLAVADEHLASFRRKLRDCKEIYTESGE